MALDEPKAASVAAQEEPTTDSVFDFLYYDAARISSFLSQFDRFGHLTEITHSERAHRNKTSSIQNQLSGSVVAVKGATTSKTDTGSQYGEDSLRTYDPRWTNALFFLDYLDEHQILQRSLNKARIGQIVLFTGDLAVFDLGLLRSMWSLPTVKKAIISGASENDTPVGNRAERRREKKSNNGQQVNEAELAVELLSVLPHSIQAAVSTDSDSVWSTLRDECLVVPPADLFMKHGLAINGSWSVVGILDALPEDFTDELEAQEHAIRQISAGLRLGAMGAQMAPFLVPSVRPLLGRPAMSFGITPLLIFREVGREGVDVPE